MSGSVIKFPPQITTDDYFGGCPDCGGSDGYFNSGRDHWFRCDEHKTRWLVGANLFSSWREETEADWQKNRQTYGGYREVAPVMPAPTEEECEAAARAEQRSNQARDFIPVIRSLHRMTKVWFFDEPFVAATKAAIASILSTQPELVVDSDGEFLSLDRNGKLATSDCLFSLVDET